MLFLNFWNSHPALFFGISFLLGCSLFFFASPLIFIPLFCFYVPLFFALNFTKQNLLLSFLVLFTAYFYSSYSHPNLALPLRGIYGNGVIHIQELQLQNSPFGSRWMYACNLTQFESNGYTLKNIPCRIFVSFSQKRNLASIDYGIEGVLRKDKNDNFILKISTKSLWIPIEGSWSLAEARFQWKMKFAEWIQSKFADSHAGSFLAGLASGNFDDPSLKNQFNKFGLQHILAISGFHFVVVGGLYALLLNLIFRKNLSSFLLILLLSAYAFFLGPQPSILRAWIMCILPLIGGFISKDSSPLNLLGVALIICLTYDPSMVKSLGFQLSFATTFAILIFYKPASRLMREILPSKTLHEALKMNHLNQLAYCCLSIIREGLALSLAVNLLALPFTLHYFHSFPIASVIYNIFFPFLTTLSMALLILGITFSFLPPLADLLNLVNNKLTQFLLGLTTPLSLESAIETTVEPVFLVFFLSIVSMMGIRWHQRALQKIECTE